MMPLGGLGTLIALPFQNPEFYRAQAMRLPTFGKPRIVSCAELHPKHIVLPAAVLMRRSGSCLSRARGWIWTICVKTEPPCRRRFVSVANSANSSRLG
ncbi:hypothetical protein [Sulfitobacter sp.]|uniref:hypothetical protein n=1 Tax=Sulfitobacter sp. TaxID=1903071 RepID=UPI0040593AB0